MVQFVFSVLFVYWFGPFTAASAATFSENFAVNPSTRGWNVFGNTNLFAWNQAEQALHVTWDSSQTNSYFCKTVGTILARDDDFGIELDLRLDDAAGGVNPAKPSTFQLAFGFQNLDEATSTNFFRGNGAHSPDLAEFTFFPRADFAPTVWPSLWSTNSQLNYNGPDDYTLIDLPTGIVMRVTMNYNAGNQTLVTAISTNGVSIGTINPVPVSPGFSDFRTGTFAISSYSDEGQDPRFGGSLLAHGVVDNILLTFPSPPIRNLAAAPSNGVWGVQFLSRTNWIYHLERTADLQNWTTAAPAVPGTGTNLLLQDLTTTAAACYRVRAQRP